MRYFTSLVPYFIPVSVHQKLDVAISYSAYKSCFRAFLISKVVIIIIVIIIRFSVFLLKYAGHYISTKYRRCVIDR